MNAYGMGNIAGRRNNGANQFRNPTDNVPGMQRWAEEQKGPVSVGHLHRDGYTLALLALRLQGHQGV